jgi:bacteriorhodopsin
MDSLNLNNILNSSNTNNTNNTQDKEKQADTNDKIVKFTFYITYAFLMTTATVTFIEAMRTSDPKIRHILNLETCISVVAAFFYAVFMEKINTPDEINYKDININRYVDWSITTPIMLLVLLLALCYNNGKSVTLGSLLIILVLNYGMLLFGFLGETGKFDKVKGNLIGFVFFVAMYGYIYIKHIHGLGIFDNNILFYAFVILWSLYGVVYFLKEKMKNVYYNILDLWSKCFVGIFFWAYFTKTITLG